MFFNFLICVLYCQVDVFYIECQNECCRSQLCFNGGICYEICDVMGKRFMCLCSLYFMGRFCEIGKFYLIICLMQFEIYINVLLIFGMLLLLYLMFYVFVMVVFMLF